jgi:hypothetical protein
MLSDSAGGISLIHSAGEDKKKDAIEADDSAPGRRAFFSPATHAMPARTRGGSGLSGVKHTTVPSNRAGYLI